MERAMSGTIRKIQYGVIPTEPSYNVFVGQELRMKEKFVVVVEILEDRNTYLEYGWFEYMIFVIPKGGRMDEKYLWRRYSKRPDFIEYDSESQDLLV